MSQLLCLGYTLHPTTRQIVDIQFCDVGALRLTLYSAEKRGPGSGKASVAAVASGFISKHYGERLQKIMPVPEVLIVGFDIVSFIRRLQLSATLPVNATPLPTLLWRYPQNFCIDLAEVLAFNPYSAEDSQRAVKERGEGLSPEDAELYHKLTESWPGPFGDAGRDLRLVITFAEQLGLCIGKGV